MLPGASQPPSNGSYPRQNIWTGTLEWVENRKGPPGGSIQKIQRQILCKVDSKIVNGGPEIKGEGWPLKLIMQMVPKNIVRNLGGSFISGDVKTVMFYLQSCDALNSLTRLMESGFAGCVHFAGNGFQQGPCSIEVLILLYNSEKQTYLGFIPNDQVGFVDRMRKVIQEEKQRQMARFSQIQTPLGAGIPQQPGMLPMQHTGTAAAAAEIVRELEMLEISE